MKRQIVKGLSMLALLLLVALASAPVTANGQAKQLIATVPFDFMVGDKLLTAGQYEVNATEAAGYAVVIQQRHSKSNAIRLVNTIAAQESKTPLLVFRRYGNTYFLSQIWERGNHIGRELRKSRQERALEREFSRIAGNRTGNYEEVVVQASTP